MKSKYKIICDNAASVQDQLNYLAEEYDLIIHGMSATNDTTTVLVELFIEEQGQ